MLASSRRWGQSGAVAMDKNELLKVLKEVFDVLKLSWFDVVKILVTAVVIFVVTT